MARTEINQMLAAAVAACEDKQAQDIRILALDPVESGLADYFLICNGTNDRQNVAITDEIEIRLKRDYGNYPSSVEGRRNGEWILMDYVDFIVHVFSPEKRAFYGLERLRKSATTLSVEELNAEIKAAITAKRPAGSIKTAAPLKTSARKAVATKKLAAKKAVAKSPGTDSKAASKAAAKSSPAKAAAKKTAAKRSAKKTSSK